LAASTALAAVLELSEEVKLALRRRLPGEMPHVRLQKVLPKRRSTQIGRVERRALRLVEEHTGDTILIARPSLRYEEPQSVPPDRATERRVGVEDVQDTVDVLEATGAHLVGEIVVLEMIVGVDPGHAAREGIPTLLGHIVNHD